MTDTVKITMTNLQWTGPNEFTGDVTRKQVETALKELNTPDFFPGEIVKHKHYHASRFLVTALAGDWVYVTDGSARSEFRAADLTIVGHLREGYIR